jgi:hypothetical protein
MDDNKYRRAHWSVQAPTAARSRRDTTAPGRCPRETCCPTVMGQEFISKKSQPEKEEMPKYDLGYFFLAI